MTLEVPRQIHQKVPDDENRFENIRFVLVFLVKIVIIHFVTTVIHESAHILTSIAFGGEVTQIKLVFLGISSTWEHINGLQGAIIALSGAGSIALLSLFVFRPLFSKSKMLFAKQFFLIGVVQLSQEMFYWTFGSAFGGIPFPWKVGGVFIDPVYLANSLSIGPFVYIFTLIFLPLWLLTRKLNKRVISEFCSLINVQSDARLEWKSKFILYSIKIYIIGFQILNIVAFVF